MQVVGASRAARLTTDPQPALLRGAAARSRARAHAGDLLATSRVQPPPLRSILGAPAGDPSRRCQTAFVLGGSRSGFSAPRPRCGEGMMVLDGPRFLGNPLMEAQSKRQPKGAGTASLRLFTINRIGVHLRCGILNTLPTSLGGLEQKVGAHPFSRPLAGSAGG